MCDSIFVLCKSKVDQPRTHSVKIHLKNVFLHAVNFARNLVTLLSININIINIINFEVKLFVEMNFFWFLHWEHHSL